MTEFISRNCGKEGYEIIIKTDSYEHYRAAVDFARRLIDHSKPKTNADRIRAMSDEELARWLEYEGGGACAEMCGWLNWLQQPAEDIDDGT